MEGEGPAPAAQCAGLAPYATLAQHSRGRRHAEPGATNRGPFQRDRDRIVHSTAFRRLKHKTQVFVFDEGDHYRTRLTHSLEVAQVARAVARTLRLDEDLAEALALAHDLGHPPFGHAGERALDAVMGPFGGFDHNAQSLRVVTRLERRYARFDGLNLTWETLEGLVKHNGPLMDRAGRPAGAYAGRALPHAIQAYQREQDLELWSFPSLEAQIAAMADDIAYDSHDVDDGLRAGLFDIADLREVALVGDCLREVERSYPGLERPRLVYETLRRLITAMVDDLVRETRARLDAVAPTLVGEVRRAGRMLAGFSPDLTEQELALKSFLHTHMYRHPRVTRVMDEAADVVRRIFTRYLNDEGALPADWRGHVDAAPEPTARARRICDFVAGMTDRFALLEHGRLFDAMPELR